MGDRASPSDLRARSWREPWRRLALEEARAFCAYTSFAEGRLLFDTEACLGFVEEWGSELDLALAEAHYQALRRELSRTLVAALDVVGERPPLREALVQPRLAPFLAPWLDELRRRTDARCQGDPALERGRGFGTTWGALYHALELTLLIDRVCGLGERGPIMRRLELDAVAGLNAAQQGLASLSADPRFRPPLRALAAELVTELRALAALDDPYASGEWGPARRRVAGRVRAAMFDPSLWRDDGPPIILAPAAATALAELLDAHRARRDLSAYRVALAAALTPDEPLIAELLLQHRPETQESLLGPPLAAHRAPIVPGLQLDLTGRFPIADLRAWTAPISSRVTSFSLSHGLVTEVTLTAAAFAAHGETLSRLAPIERFHLIEMSHRSC